MLEEAREENIPLRILSPKEAIPPGVEVVITTQLEAQCTGFDPERMVLVEDTPHPVGKARQLLEGLCFNIIVVGVDPGRSPGIAVLACNRVIEVHQTSQRHTCSVIKQIMDRYEDAEVIVRIGSGAGLFSTQLLNQIAELGVAIEVVDEANTTPHLGRGLSSASDIIAAINIALTPGRAAKPVPIKPTRGDLRVIQEQSRRYSGGKATISKELARKVATGALSLEEAVQQQRDRKFPP